MRFLSCVFYVLLENILHSVVCLIVKIVKQVNILIFMVQVVLVKIAKLENTVLI